MAAICSVDLTRKACSKLCDEIVTMSNNYDTHLLKTPMRQHYTLVITCQYSVDQKASMIISIVA